MLKCSERLERVVKAVEVSSSGDLEIGGSANPGDCDARRSE